jgi:glycosyltransferase involved in cell wall biosynthesis
MTIKAHQEFSPNAGKPLVAVVGGPLLHTRLDLFEMQRAEFEIVGVGASEEAQAAFASRGFPFHRIALARGADPVGDLAADRRMRRIFQILQPAIVHTFQSKPSIWGRLAAAEAGVPVIIGTIAGLGSLYTADGMKRRVLRGVYERLQRSACERSDLTIFQNESDRNYFLKRGIAANTKTTLIPGMGIRTERFDPARFTPADRFAIRREFGVDEGSPLVTMVGRLVRTKGVLEYARAARLLKAGNPAVRFLLVGWRDKNSIDPLSTREFEFIKRAGIFAGRRPDIPEILAASDIYVLPATHREGMPRSLMEAMSMALPVVTTDVAGCRDAVEHEQSGLIVPPCNVAALADGIERLVNNISLRRGLGKFARERVIERFSLKKIAALTASNYHRLLKARFGERYTPGLGLEAL